MAVRTVLWLSDTGAPLNGQGGCAGNGTEDLRRFQGPPASAAFLVEATGNAARNRGSLSGQPQDALYCRRAIYYAYYLLIYVD